MAYTRCRTLWPQFAIISATPGTQVIDANNDGVGMAFIAPKTGNISKVGYNITAKAGTPPTYRIGIEGIAATRAPDGTYKASGTSYVDDAPTATGWEWHTLGAAAAVTAGDSLCASVRYQTGTIDGSNNITVATTISTSIAGAHPYILTLTAGTWAAVTGYPAIAVQYDDGTTIVGYPYSSFSNNAWNSGSSPKFRGNLWTPQVSSKTSGVWIFDRLPNNADLTVAVYKDNDASAMASGSVAIDPDVVVSGTGASNMAIFVPWGALITHAVGSLYRFVIVPTTVNSNTTFIETAVPDAASLAQWGGQDWQKTTASTAGTWTDTANSFFPMFPIIEEVDIPSGGGGLLVHPGMGGGARG